MDDTTGQDRGDDIIDAIYDALDGGDAEGALTLARAQPAGEDDPVLHFLAGFALTELDRPAEAAVELERAVELDPEDFDYRSELGLALYRCCRFDDAVEHIEAALTLSDSHADAHYIAALLIERHGRHEEADGHFDRAFALDPDRWALPQRVEWEEFDRQIGIARSHLPEEFRKHLEQVGLIVEDLPPEAVLFESDPPLDPELLGLFTGVALDEQTQFSAGGDLPARIYLFKRNLERLAGGTDLSREIAVTLYHELGHYLGLEEEDLERVKFD